MNIGNRVRQLRQAKNMKIADLAEAIGVDAANISRLETGKQKQFTEQTLSNIAKSLGVDIADLFTSALKSNTVYKNSNNEDVAQVKDVFRIEMLDISASAGNGLIQGGDVIDVIHAIEYRTDNAVSMFGGRPANHIKGIFHNILADFYIIIKIQVNTDTYQVLQFLILRAIIFQSKFMSHRRSCLDSGKASVIQTALFQAITDNALQILLHDSRNLYLRSQFLLCINYSFLFTH